MTLKGLIQAAAANIFGIALFKPSVNSTTAFQVQDKDGNVIFNVDTTNGYVGIGTIAPVRKFHVIGPDGAVAAPTLGAKDLMVFENNGNANFAFIHPDGNNSGLKWYIPSGATQYAAITSVYNGGVPYIVISHQRVVIGSVATPTSPLQVVGIPVYANNAAAITGGLTVGAFYRTGADPDPICIVH